ncbi:MAG: TetR/AcrR family transcriptional regulator [Deltaproteobacteria bacterium]|nr:TetR/AcrR family transcriptional regulator [Deltaproteobacteria bacterium]MBW2447862.1 TetR/AcrR family transcriptional regulator [Deltaproteobacteria bacterium]
MSPRLAVQESRDHQRQRILKAFEERARANGPRGVVMAELARDLGISTRTLYQHFASKAELVHEILGRWAVEVDADQARRLTSKESLQERMIDVAAQERDPSRPRPEALRPPGALSPRGRPPGRRTLVPWGLEPAGHSRLTIRPESS